MTTATELFAAIIESDENGFSLYVESDDGDFSFRVVDPAVLARLDTSLTGYREWRAEGERERAAWIVAGRPSVHTDWIEDDPAEALREQADHYNKARKENR